MRIDKWLWAARFFKTRSLSAQACDQGRIQSNGVTAKPAREVKTGDRLRVKTKGGDFEIEVLELSEIRGPAPMAQTLYRESEESRLARLKASEERKALPAVDGAWLDGVLGQETVSPMSPKFMAARKWQSRRPEGKRRGK